MVLQAIATIFLLLALVKNICAVFWPKKARGWAKEFTKTNRDVNYLLSFVLLATGLIMSLTVIRLVNLETFIVSAFGFIMLVASLLVYNDMHRDIVKIVLKRQDKWVQKTALMMVILISALLWVLRV